MFEILREKIRARKMARIIHRDPLYMAALTVIREALSDTRAGIGKHATEKTRHAIYGQVLERVTGIIVSPNHIAANREQLVAMVLYFAQWQVLLLPPESDEPDDPTGLRGRPGITGGLLAHLPELAQVNKSLKEIAFEVGSTDLNDLKDGVLLRYWRAALDMQVYNAIRIQLGDKHPDSERDWYRPFVEAACAWEESEYRREIGMPDVLAQEDPMGDLAALKYSTFMNFVLDPNCRYPNHAWQEHYSKRA